MDRMRANCIKKERAVADYLLADTRAALNQIMFVMIKENRFEPVIVTLWKQTEQFLKNGKTEMEHESLCLTFQFKTIQVMYVIAIQRRCLTVSIVSH